MGKKSIADKLRSVLATAGKLVNVFSNISPAMAFMNLGSEVTCMDTAPPKELPKTKIFLGSTSLRSRSHTKAVSASRYNPAKKTVKLYNQDERSDD